MGVALGKKNVASVVTETLAAVGVNRIYVVAGDSLNAITDSIRAGRYPVGSGEARRSGHVRRRRGKALPHHVAFEKAEFKDVGEAAAALKKLGFIGGTGHPVKYDDFAGSVDDAGMTQLTPM